MSIYLHTHTYMGQDLNHTWLSWYFIIKMFYSYSIVGVPFAEFSSNPEQVYVFLSARKT